MIVIGVDVGGTKTAAAQVFHGNPPQLRNAVVRPTRAAEGLDVSLSQIYGTIEACLSPDVEAIGICAPGPLNPKTGVVINPPNLPGWSNVPLAEWVTRRFNLPCRVENDANAAGLAEVLFGAARGYPSVFYATLSTGIGAGIILDGRIYHGKNGAAAEGGHVSVDYLRQPYCNCGVPGCIEGLASGSALARQGLDPTALTAEQFEEWTVMLGAWLGSVVSLLDPDIIVIGGGMANVGEPLFSRLRSIVPTRTINQFASATPIVPARLAADVGVLGAAAVMFQHLGFVSAMA
jgi:glucokinase